MLPSKKYPNLHFEPPDAARRYVMDLLMDQNNCGFAQACSIHDTMNKEVRAGIIEDRFPGELEYVLIA